MQNFRKQLKQYIEGNIALMLMLMLLKSNALTHLKKLRRNDRIKPIIKEKLIKNVNQ